jgi:small multidrug resistance family-3 protein
LVSEEHILEENMSPFKPDETPVVIRAFAVFLLAGMLEVGGGFGVWKWFREGSSLGWGLLGMGVLALYGIAAALSPLEFGRAYAAYGGVFVVLSIAWGMAFDHFRPDVRDWTGAVLILSGIVFMVWGRR